MKPQDIENNSRAAFYLKRRRAFRNLPAAHAWHMAGVDVSNLWKAAQAEESANATLAAAWNAAGQKEPKAHSPEGEALAAARAAERDARTRRSHIAAYPPSDLRAQPPGVHTTGYFGNGNFYCLEADTGTGVFREVKAAQDCEGGPDHNGWYTDPNGISYKDGTGLFWGIVARLSGKDGNPRFIPGYQMGGVHAGACLDLEQVTDSERDAAQAADSLAENAATEEKEYQAAWRAGQLWADLGDEIAEERRDVLALLKENRESGGSRDLPAIHATIRAAVCDSWKGIQAKRKKRKELASGESEILGFYPGESRLCAAFCEGAEIEEMPA